MTKKLSPEAKKLVAACKSAAAELREIDGVERKIDSYSVRRLATARLFSANVEMRLMRGEPVTSVEVKSADEMITAARETAHDDAPTTVTVKIIDATPASLASGVAIEPVPLKGLGWRGPGSPPRTPEEIARKAAAEAAAKKLLPPQKVVTPTPETKTQQATSSDRKRPTPPAKKDPIESNRQFHAGGYVREARMSDGWMSNMGAMSRRRNESNRTHYQPWPNPTREH